MDMSPINLNRIQEWIDQGRLDPTKPITVKELAKSRCLHGVKDGVKLLARGSEQLRTPIEILVSRASAAAIDAVEAAGGKVVTRFYTPTSVKRVLKGEAENSWKPLAAGQQNSILSTLETFKYRLPDPTSRKDIEYYRDPAHRGYLSHTLKKGQGPSLFFKAPGTKKVQKKVKAALPGGLTASENKLW
jgi:large subunit ribosomal protein L15